MHLEKWPSSLGAGPQKTNIFEPQGSRHYWDGVGSLKEGRLDLMGFKLYFDGFGAQTHAPEVPCQQNVAPIVK